MIDERPLTDVAVGLVFDSSDRVLLGQRPDGKPYAGWWEFPGGKLEPGESVATALARELHEELGLEVAHSLPWIVREHSYPHARVRLHFRRVFDWRGPARSREGQAFAWVDPRAIDRAPLLPATLPILAMLRLPPRCLHLSLNACWPAGVHHDDMLVLRDAGQTTESQCADLLARARRCFGTVLLDPSWPARFNTQCDGRLLASAPASGLPGGIVGRCVERLEDLSTDIEVSVHFIVVAEDVSAYLRDNSQEMVSAAVPVYAVYDPHLANAAREAGFQGAWADAARVSVAAPPSPGPSSQGRAD